MGSSSPWYLSIYLYKERGYTVPVPGTVALKYSVASRSAVLFYGSIVMVMMNRFISFFVSSVSALRDS